MSRRSPEVSSPSFLVLVLISCTSSGNVFIFRFSLTPDNFCEFVSPSLLLLLSDARFSTRKFDRNFLRRENSSPKTIFCGVLFCDRKLLSDGWFNFVTCEVNFIQFYLGFVLCVVFQLKPIYKQCDTEAKHALLLGPYQLNGYIKNISCF